MFAKLIRPKSDMSWPQGKVFLELKSVLLEVGYIEKWQKFAYLESKVPHLKFRVMRDRVYLFYLNHCKMFENVLTIVKPNRHMTTLHFLSGRWYHTTQQLCQFSQKTK